MSRRLVNTQFLVELVRPGVSVDGGSTLVMLLENFLTPVARKRFGGPASDLLVRRAALRARDLALAGRMWFIAPEGAFNLLRNAVDQDVRLRFALFAAAQQQADEDERERDDNPIQDGEEDIVARAANELNGVWPLWLLALLDLLCLTRRSWLYLRLYTTRDRAWGWKGRLTATIWGAKHGQCALTRELKSLALLIVELGSAWASVSEGNPPPGALATLLADLNHAARTEPVLPENGPGRLGLLARVLAVANNDRQSEIAKALDRLKNLRGSLGDPLLANAWAALSGEMAHPTAAMPPGESLAILDELTALQPPVAAERAPNEILTDIFAMEPATDAQEPCESPPQVRELLVPHLFASVQPDGPEASVLARLVLPGRESFASLRAALLRHQPAELSLDLLTAAETRLKGWLASLGQMRGQSSAWTQDYEPPSSLELLGLPGGVDEVVLPRASDIIHAWIVPGAVRPTWAALDRPVAEAIRGAVAAACLERLCQAMDTFFRQRQQQAAAAK